MNDRQKELLKFKIENEQEVLNTIKNHYETALEDINTEIARLKANDLTQSKIYQIQYQEALEQQVSGILENLKSNNYETISEYLNNCYDDGFIGNLYDLQGQGVPLMFPMDQTQVVESITRQVEKLKFSERLYKHIDDLKAVTKSEIARGIANDYSYADIARNISRYSEANYKRAFTIAQTEGGRIYSEAKYHSQLKAQEMGADVYKQWDATRDSRTRPDHKALHGQLRKVDEAFDIGPYSAQHPLGFGVARLDIRCRCDTLQRAGWALDDDEIEQLREQGDIVEIEAEDYGGFKKQYNQRVKMNLQLFAKDEDIDTGNLEKYMDYLYNDEGSLVVTDDFTNVNHYTIPKKYKNYAVVNHKGWNGTVDRTIYNEKGNMIKQINSSHHGKPKYHKYGAEGEHAHDYFWNEDGSEIIDRTTRDLSTEERKENQDILP
jgi:SPP1 gp7 family putative phage head morphogenesis protein